MNIDGWYWLGWLALAFLPKEIFEALEGKGGTFSEWIWWAFGVTHKVPWSRARRTCLGAFLLSLTAHLVLGWSVLPVIVFGLGIAAVLVRAVGWERKDEA